MQGQKSCSNPCFSVFSRSGGRGAAPGTGKNGEKRIGTGFWPYRAGSTELVALKRPLARKAVAYHRAPYFSLLLSLCCGCHSHDVRSPRLSDLAKLIMDTVVNREGGPGCFAMHAVRRACAQCFAVHAPCVRAVLGRNWCLRLVSCTRAVTHSLANR